MKTRPKMPPKVAAATPIEHRPPTFKTDNYKRVSQVEYQQKRSLVDRFTDCSKWKLIGPVGAQRLILPYATTTYQPRGNVIEGATKLLHLFEVHGSTIPAIYAAGDQSRCEICGATFEHFKSSSASSRSIGECECDVAAIVGGIKCGSWYALEIKWAPKNVLLGEIETDPDLAEIREQVRAFIEEKLKCGEKGEDVDDLEEDEGELQNEDSELECHQNNGEEEESAGGESVSQEEAQEVIEKSPEATDQNEMEKDLEEEVDDEEEEVDYSSLVLDLSLGRRKTAVDGAPLTIEKKKEKEVFEFNNSEEVEANVLADDEDIEDGEDSEEEDESNELPEDDKEEEEDPAVQVAKAIAVVAAAVAHLETQLNQEESTEENEESDEEESGSDAEEEEEEDYAAEAEGSRNLASSDEDEQSDREMASLPTRGMVPFEQQQAILENVAVNGAGGVFEDVSEASESEGGDEEEEYEEGEDQDQDQEEYQDQEENQEQDQDQEDEEESSENSDNQPPAEALNNVVEHGENTAGHYCNFAAQPAGHFGHFHQHFETAAAPNATIFGHHAHHNHSAAGGGSNYQPVDFSFNTLPPNYAGTATWSTNFGSNWNSPGSSSGFYHQPPMAFPGGQLFDHQPMQQQQQYCHPVEPDLPFPNGSFVPFPGIQTGHASVNGPLMSDHYPAHQSNIFHQHLPAKRPFESTLPYYYHEENNNNNNAEFLAAKRQRIWSSPEVQIPIGVSSAPPSGLFTYNPMPNYVPTDVAASTTSWEGFYPGAINPNPPGNWYQPQPPEFNPFLPLEAAKPAPTAHYQAVSPTIIDTANQFQRPQHQWNPFENFFSEPNTEPYPVTTGNVHYEKQDPKFEIAVPLSPPPTPSPLPIAVQKSGRSGTKTLQLIIKFPQNKASSPEEQANGKQIEAPSEATITLKETETGTSIQCHQMTSSSLTMARLDLPHFNFDALQQLDSTEAVKRLIKLALEAPRRIKVTVGFDESRQLVLANFIGDERRFGPDGVDKMMFFSECDSFYPVPEEERATIQQNALPFFIRLVAEMKLEHFSTPQGLAKQMAQMSGYLN